MRGLTITWFSHLRRRPLLTQDSFNHLFNWSTTRQTSERVCRNCGVVLCQKSLNRNSTIIPKFERPLLYHPQQTTNSNFFVNMARKGAQKKPTKKSAETEEKEEKTETDQTEDRDKKKKTEETEEKEEKTETEQTEEKDKKETVSKGKKRKSEAGDGETTGEPKAKLKSRPSISDSFGDTDFSTVKKSSSGKPANFKISSWNINGIRAWLDKEGTSYLKAEQPDVLCVQELKCDVSKIPAETEVEGYTTHWLSGDTEGYSGVGIYYKTKPIKITDGIGVAKHDNEGRVVTAEFENFYLVNTYIPNAGRGLVRLKYRTKEWDVAFREYVKSLDKKKPVVWCGDLNVAHEVIDIKNAKGNKKNAGFTQEERDGFSAFLAEGFFDSFRFLYPEQEGAYTFWTYMMNARAKNVGWRLDYFVLSERLKENLCDSEIRSKVMGSDHCPIVLQLTL